MANLNSSKTLFFVTSPRTPFKMRPEIELLTKMFSTKPWNEETQIAFGKALSKADFFRGSAKLDTAFSARDRINRAPKALGFVDLAPVIELTPAGKMFLESSRHHEIFTRQILKFQLPSPFHTDKNGRFFVKPYLEMLRLIFDLGTLSKDEIKIFGLQLTNYTKFDEVKYKIRKFREAIKKLDRTKTSYKKYTNQVFEREILEIYNEEITKGATKTRETHDKSLAKFINTKKGNHRDYADACFRYLRATELVVLTSSKFFLKISEAKEQDVKYILETVDRKPVIFKNEKDFKNYLFDPTIPKLAVDNKEQLIKLIKEYKYDKTLKLDQLGIEELKDLRDELINAKKQVNIQKQVTQIQTYTEFEDIINTYQDINGKNLVDLPLMMEWNTWRAFVMLDDGSINGNFRVDDEGMPLSTAIGNIADIECKYKDFNMIVEVTLSSGQKQYEMEGEPVARHLAQAKKSCNKETFCMFIAPKLNEATLAYFYSLHKIPITYYGGISKVIPLDLSTFIEMLTNAYNSTNKPTSLNIKNFLEHLSQKAIETDNEQDWYKEIIKAVKEWTTLKIA